jgi:predicted dienelactone hydrolase
VNRAKRAVTACAVALVLTAAAALPATAAVAATSPGPRTLTLPPPTGRYAIGVVDLHLLDGSRAEPWNPAQDHRELMVSVVYPARDAARYPLAHQMTEGVAAGFDALAGPGNYGVPAGTVDWAATLTHEHEGAPAAAGRHPVVLYSPGAGDVRSWETALVDQLASEGYVVVTIDHTYEAAAVQFPHGRIVDSNILTWYAKAAQDGTVPQFLQRLADVRAADTSFVLDELDSLAAGRNPDAEGRRLPVGLSSALDVRHVGMFGQSAGGFTALETMYQDPRIAAGIDMDGTLAYTQLPDGTHLSPVARHGLDRPFLLLGSAGADGESRAANPSWASLWDHSTGRHRELTLPGTRHGSFTDAEALLPQLAGVVPDERVTADIGTANPVVAAVTVAIEQGLISGFFHRWL